MVEEPVEVPARHGLLEPARLDGAEGVRTVEHEESHRGGGRPVWAPGHAPTLATNLGQRNFVGNGLTERWTIEARFGIVHDRVEPYLGLVAGLYRSSLEQHGPSAMGVGWRTEESQRLRFEKLLSVVDLARGDRIDVNDLGCGYGALLGFLQERQVPLGTFCGYDISKEMLSVARDRASAPSEFIASSRVTQLADYSFASGIFNVKLDCDDHSWMSYVQDVIRNLAEHSRVGFAFNLLSTYSDYQEEHLFYGDPLHWFDWCKRNVTPWVTLLHDYPLFEWTITARVTDE